MLKISFLVLLISVTVTFFRWLTKDPPEGTMSFPKLASFNGRAHVPLPRGGYVVGSTDGMTASNLLVRFYYPVEPASSPQDHTKHFDQWPPWIPALEVADGYLRFKMSRSVPFLARIFRWLIHDPLVPNVFGADMINQNKKMPVVIFSHGMGAIRTTYSTLLTEIASAGYFVAAVEHADGSASATINADGEWMYERKLLPDEDEYTVRNAQVGHRVEECESTFRLLQDMNNDAMQTKWASRFTPTESFLRSLVSRLDLEENVWISGHSFGGATAVKSLYTSRKPNGDAMFKGAFVLDSWLFPIRKEADDLIFASGSKPASPPVFVNCEKFQSERNLDTMSKFEDEEAGDNVLTLRDTAHYGPTDIPTIFMGSYARAPFEAMFKMGRGRGNVTEAVNNSQEAPLPAEDALVASTDLFLGYLYSSLGEGADSNLTLEHFKTKYKRFIIKGSDYKRHEP